MSHADPFEEIFSGSPSASEWRQRAAPSTSEDPFAPAPAALAPAPAAPATGQLPQTAPPPPAVTTLPSPTGVQDSSVRSEGRTAAIATPFVTFKVQQATQGSEMLKPITYFPIVSELRLPCPHEDVLAAMSPFPAAPHQKHCATGAGQRRVRWEGDTISTSQRRYSELVEFRNLLVLQFPMLVIPPLAKKSTADNFSTYMQNEALLRQQQRSILRFLREIGKIPEIIYFNDFTPNFFQYPREKFYEWMARIRDVTGVLRGANSSLEEHRPRRKAANSTDGSGGSTAERVDEAVTALATESTKIVKGIVGAVSSWWFPDASGGSHAASVQNRQDIAARADKAYHDHPQVQFWAKIDDDMFARKAGLVEAAESLMKFIAADDAANQALMDTAEALDQFSMILASSSESFAKSRDAARLCGLLTKDIADVHHPENDHRYTQIYEVLLFEASYLESAIEASQFVRCLWRRKIENELDRFMKPSDVKEFNVYLDFVHTRLATEVKSCIRKHHHRMITLVKRNADISLSTIASEVGRTAAHPFVSLMRSPDYSVFE